MCHLILLLPLLGLVVFWIWRPLVAVPVYAVILVLSLGFYWWIVRSMRQPVRAGPEGMRGVVGRVIEVGERRARVQQYGEVWNADLVEGLRPGDRVEVVAVQDLRLMVRRRDEPDFRPKADR
jgi:membrane protein implicated in regulation of membrane protease activity